MAENNENNERQQQEQQQGHEFPLLAIHDIDGWLRFNGLRSADEDPPEQPAYGSFMSDLNRTEATAKQDEERRYQEMIHEKLFKDQLDTEKEQQDANQKLLEAWEHELMEIQTSGTNFRVPLAKLAAECDTVFTLASSRRYMKNILMNRNNFVNDNDDGEEKRDDGTEMVILSLDDYPVSAVQEFINLVLDQKNISDIDHVVDCCQIGHYLQCARILQGTVKILLQNVDSENCLSIMSLSDRLELPDLFERALFHMMKSMDQLENHEVYADISPELKNRIADIRQVFTKAKDQPQKTLYFTSLQEYIAIFAENVQYHRERLEQAKEQNTMGYSAYQQSKIDKQELRVLALEAMLQEQKRMFGTNANKNHMNKKRAL